MTSGQTEDHGKTTRHAPERLYLQFGPDGEGDGDPPLMDEVTWCADRIWDSDVLYVRADVAQERRNADLEAALRSIIDDSVWLIGGLHDGEGTPCLGCSGKINMAEKALATPDRRGTALVAD